MDHDDYMAVGVDTTLSGLEERRPLTLLELPNRDGGNSLNSSTSDLGSPIYERRSRHDIVSQSEVDFVNKRWKQRTNATVCCTCRPFVYFES